MDKRSFITVFGKSELKSILAKWQPMTLLVLVVILALWCIGFSSGAEKYLRQKMDSPFVKFLSVDLDYYKATDQEFMDTLEVKLNRQLNKDKFHYDKINFISYWTPYFFSTKSNPIMARVRAIDEDDDLYRFIFNEGLVVSSNPKRIDQARWSVIVTQRYLERLGHVSGSFPAYLKYVYSQNKTDTPVAIPIAAIVQQLPDNCDMLVSWELYQAFEGRYGTSNPLDPNQLVHQSTKRFFISGITSQMFQDNISGIDGYDIQPNEETYGEGIIVQVYSQESAKILQAALMQLFKAEVEIILDFNAQGINVQSERNLTFDKVVVQFSDLERVGDFETFMLEDKRLGLPIDMNSIEARNNFLLFNKISNILSIVLSIISIGFIITFLTRTIAEHIDRNAKNLGTLKAFGLSNQNIGWIYSGISGVLVLSIFAFSFLVSKALGGILTNGLMKSLDITNDGTSLYSLDLNWVMIIYFVILPVVLIAVMLYVKIRNQTPGDLIYER